MTFHMLILQEKLDAIFLSGLVGIYCDLLREPKTLLAKSLLIFTKIAGAACVSLKSKFFNQIFRLLTD